MLKIGFLGPKGSFSEEALKKYINCSHNYQEFSFNTIQDVILAVDSQNIDEAIIPIENSIEGGINITMDMLAIEVSLKIKAEIIIPIEQSLLVKKDTNINQIKTIFSHPQAIGQCTKYISQKLQNCKINFTSSTSEAALYTANSKENVAAIASKFAALTYGLEVISEGIQDTDLNATRFIIISKNYAEKTGNDKTSLVFSTENRPGSLYKILDIFNLWDINMTRIESRPAKNKIGKYIFWIDLEGHIQDRDIKDAIKMVQRKTSFIKFIGSYPKCN